MNALARWMETASLAETKRLAKKAKTTVGTLRQIAGAYRKTDVTADLASRIDRASLKVMQHGSVPKGVLILIPRESLSNACKACEFAKRCRSD